MGEGGRGGEGGGVRLCMDLVEICTISKKKSLLLTQQLISSHQLAVVVVFASYP